MAPPHAEPIDGAPTRPLGRAILGGVRRRIDGHAMATAAENQEGALGDASRVACDLDEKLRKVRTAATV